MQKCQKREALTICSHEPVTPRRTLECTLCSENKGDATAMLRIILLTLKTMATQHEFESSSENKDETHARPPYAFSTETF